MKMHEQGKSFYFEPGDGSCSSGALSLVGAFPEGGASGARAPLAAAAEILESVGGSCRTTRLGTAEARLGAREDRLSLGDRPQQRASHFLRHGRNRLRPETPRVVRRYEKSRPGELLHLDMKYLYRSPNSSREYAYAGVDDFSREAVAAVRPIVPVRMPQHFWKKSSPLALSNRSGDDRQRSDLQYAPCLLLAAANALSTMLPQLGNRTLANQSASSANQRQG